MSGGRSARARGLRVAIFTESYLPYLSGVTVSTEALARGLGAAGHRVLLIAPRPADGAAPPGAGSPGPDPQYAWLPSFQGPPPAPAGYRMPLPMPSDAGRAAHAFAPDVVHAQSPFVSGLMARRVAQRRRAPLVFTHHTRFADYGHYLGPLARPGRTVLRGYVRDYWTTCAAVIAPGSELASEIRAALGLRERPLVRAIPTGVDVVAIGALAPVDPRPPQGWPDDAVVVISVGRLAAEKSVDLLLEAFAVAAATDRRLRLLLVGDGPAEATLRRRSAAPDLAGRVAFTGRLPRAEALALARASDVFLFASRTETQGLVLAEALAAGLPVVAVQGPGVADAVRHRRDGVVVPAEPAADLAARLGAAVAEVASSPELRSRMAGEASSGAGRFDVTRRVREVAELYAELLTAGAAGG